MKHTAITKADIGSYAIIRRGNSFVMAEIKTVSDYRIGYGNRLSFSKYETIAVIASPTVAREKFAMILLAQKAYQKTHEEAYTMLQAAVGNVLGKQAVT